MAIYITPSCGHPERGRSEAGIYEFYKTQELSSGAPVTLRIFASVRYKLYVNGKYICEGPCRSDEFMRRYDTVTTDAFVKGKNEITAIVVHLTEKISFATGYKSAKPMFLLDARSDTDNFCTDGSWSCRYRLGHTLCGDDTFVFPFEKINGDAEYSPIKLEEYNKQCHSVDFDDGYRARWGTTPFRLAPREIPMLYPKEYKTLVEVRRGDGFVEYDAGTYMTAYVKIGLASECDAKIIYAECYRFPDGKKLRDDTEGYLAEEHAADTVYSGKNGYTFESFWFRAFRYIHIETTDTSKILSVEAARFNYPIKQDGEFECSDTTFNEMQKISINTMMCCTSEIFVDCPFYEQQQYIMDSAVEAAVFMRMTSDTALIKKCISEFAASQLPSGLLCANYPQAAEPQIIPGFSIFWIYLLNSYFEQSADTDFVRRHSGTIDKLLNYFDGTLTADGLVTVSHEWDYVDWVPGWDRGTAPVPDGKPHTIYSLYLAYGLLTASRLMRACGRCSLADEYYARYTDLRRAINEKLYVPEKGMYHDGDGTFSMHTIIWSILSEIADGEAAKEAAKKLVFPDIAKSSYSMNFFLFRALEKCGMYNEAVKYFDGWKKMIELHCTTWCENPDDPRSECHAWSCAPLYEFSANVLGVKYSAEDIIVIKPHTLDLKSAKGKVPTRFGIVHVEWHIDEKGFEITVDSPDDVKKRLIMPDGRIFESTDAHISAL